MKPIIILFFIFSFVNTQGQKSFPDKKYDSLLSTAVHGLKEANIYFVGQGHGNEANTIIEKGFLFSLNEKFNVRFYILEFGHSLAFLLNQYLETGQDSILNFINPLGNFRFVKLIKSFNDTLAASRRIRFFGLDFENRLNGKWTKKAIEIISGKINLPSNNPLQILLNTFINKPPKFEKENLVKLKTYLYKNEQDCRKLLGKYYIDLLLISKAQFDFSPRRDKAMLDNFKLLNRELIQSGENPKFFASFGVGHINPENKNGLPYRLLENKDSPIKGKVCVVGTQYYKCIFNVSHPSNGPSGTLSSLCKKSVTEKINYANDTKEKTITFFSKSELKNFDCEALNRLDGLVIIRNFDATSSWEF